ncbi:uncharacterized protein ACOB8E_023346 [Sarcophilus harrisii]
MPGNGVPAIVPRASHLLSSSEAFRCLRLEARGSCPHPVRSGGSARGKTAANLRARGQSPGVGAAAESLFPACSPELKLSVHHSHESQTLCSKLPFQQFPHLDFTLPKTLASSLIPTSVN